MSGKIKSYVNGEWFIGQGSGAEVFNAVNGNSVGLVTSEGIDFKDMLNYARTVGGPGLRKLSFHDRANRLKALGKHLIEKKDRLYEVSSWTGATTADSWVDIEGGAGTLFTYSGLVRRELPNETYLVEGDPEGLSSKGTFLGQHILVPKEGVAVHINAFNFPCWGMLEKIAPSLAAGMPVVIKPASVSCFLTEAMVQDMIASNIFPEGSIQLVSGSLGDTFDHLNEQDVVTFTGSAVTGRKLRTHPNIVANSVPFTMEADSLNCSILGANVSPDAPEFDLFIKEVAKEMTVKAGQKCTAIRRTIVPRSQVDAVAQALAARLDKITLGDPSVEGVRMGSLVGRDQVADVWENVGLLSETCEIIHGGTKDFEVVGADAEAGAFFPKTLLLCDNPISATSAHAVEAFGPVSTLMPYDSIEEAIEISKLGKGSLVGSIVTADDQEAKQIILNTAAYHGRMLVLNSDCARESTGHGSPMPQLVHGGPGRAGGGEELGGLRAVKHYMQRTAIQGSPTTLMHITNEYVPGAQTKQDVVHPFRKYFEELEIGDTLITHRRTLSEADVVNFACLSGDHFYAHLDETAAKDSFFGKRVAHGYLIISAAAGMFVDPAPGPVIANYGMENLRFVEPVGFGDTIQVRLTVKRKIKKDKRDPEEKPNGVVVWDVEVTNQNDDPVALYSILTLVERKNDD
ncbi:MAG: phenylacetic acid degradation bifunctional protein PaaZ [Pseudomonadales bacterium]